MQNDKGDEKLDKRCGLAMAPELLVAVVRASNRPAAAVESIRNDLITTLSSGFASITEAAKVASLRLTGEK